MNAKDAIDNLLREALAEGGTNRVLHLSPDFATALQGVGMSSLDVREASRDEHIEGVDADAFLLGTYGWRIPVCIRREWEWRAAVLDLDEMTSLEMRKFPLVAQA